MMCLYVINSGLGGFDGTNPQEVFVCWVATIPIELGGTTHQHDQPDATHLITGSCPYHIHGQKKLQKSDSTSGNMVFYVLLSILVMWFQCGEIPRKCDSTIFQANAHIKTGYATHPNLQSALRKNTDNPRYSNGSALFRTCCQLVQQVSSNRYPYPRYPRMMIA